MLRRPIHPLLIWTASVGVCMIPMLLLATQQWAALRETPKAMSWIAAALYQAPSWLLLGLILPLVFRAIHCKPLSRSAPGRLVLHLGLSVVFGAAFLFVAVPARHAFHAHPVHWRMFGDALFKSAPQFMVLGALGYWLAVIAASIVEMRARLRGARAELEAAEEQIARLESVSDGKITLNTARGVAVLDAGDIAWIESTKNGPRLHTTDHSHLARHSLGELESVLEPYGIVRTHRSALVNLSRITELVGGRGRDGRARLDTGDLVPISRRRRNLIEDHLKSSGQSSG